MIRKKVSRFFAGYFLYRGEGLFLFFLELAVCGKEVFIVVRVQEPNAGFVLVEIQLPWGLELLPEVEYKLEFFFFFLRYNREFERIITEYDVIAFCFFTFFVRVQKS